MSCAAAVSSSSSSAASSRRLEGKVTLITGGASGIGESISRLFRQHGARICIIDLQDELGHQLCESLGGNHYACFIHGDVTIEDDMRRAVDFVVGKYGGLDIMVNNAGVAGQKIKDIRDVDFDGFKRIFSINVDGVFLGMKHAARIMIPQKRGSIISLGSVASVMGGLGPHAYAGSKHAVVGLTKSVAAELGKHGIRVNCVSPYAVPTKLAMPHKPDSAGDEGVKEFLAFVGSHANLKGVKLLPEDVAQAVLFLASDDAKYVSALNLVVDGGFTSVNNNLQAFE